MNTETNVSWEDWVGHDDYFDDLAVLGVGPFHPGGIDTTRELIETRNWNDLRVLDIGAGQGTTMRFLLAEGAEVIGIEPSPYMREAAHRSGIDRSRLLPEEVEAVPLDTTFDVIIAEGVVGFVDEGVIHLLQLTEQLKESGGLFITDWEPHDRESRSEYGFDIQTRTSSDTIARKLEKNGFDCHVDRSPAVAKAFSLDIEMALKRASRFFPDAPTEALEVAVRRKIDHMHETLPEDISCYRYMLRATHSQ